MADHSVVNAARDLVNSILDEYPSHPKLTFEVVALPMPDPASGLFTLQIGLQIYMPLPLLGDKRQFQATAAGPSIHSMSDEKEVRQVVFGLVSQLRAQSETFLKDNGGAN